MPYKDPEKARAHALERGRRYRERHPERYKALRAEARKRARERNPEHEREMNRIRDERWREKDPEHARALARKRALAHYYRHHEKLRERSRLQKREARAAVPPEEHACRRLRRVYGITLAQRDEMLAAQGGRCKVCGTKQPGVRGWVVDHCHDKKHIRGILCNKCNTALGLADDDPQILEWLAEYLRKDRTER